IRSAKNRCQPEIGINGRTSMAHSSRVGAEYAVAEARRKAVEHGEKKPPGFADRGLNPIQGEESEETDAGYRSAASVATGLTHGHTSQHFPDSWTPSTFCKSV
ncbi:hypothetical protein, partial [Herbaspirillum lusitanum]|uniref:hypothetical protein n=1 Tax=Herbaspirillum lusitanum TaxID=213312 RepID=UPI001EE65528